MKLHVVGYGMLYEDSYEEQPEETHSGIPGQMLVFITLYCTLFIRAVRKVLLDLCIVCDSAFSEPLAAAHLDHTENYRLILMPASVWFYKAKGQALPRNVRFLDFEYEPEHWLQFTSPCLTPLPFGFS